MIIDYDPVEGGGEGTSGHIGQINGSPDVLLAPLIFTAQPQPQLFPLTIVLSLASLSESMCECLNG